MLCRQRVLWTLVASVEVLLVILVFAPLMFSRQREPVQLGQVGVPAPPGVSAVAIIAPPGGVSQAVHAVLDTERRIGKYFSLQGWAYVTGQETRGQKVYIQLEKPDGVVVHYSTFPVERPDVGSFFKSSLYDASGFTAVIPVADGIDVDACSICLVVRNDSGTYKSARWRTGLRLSSRAEIMQPASESRAVKFGVDTSEDRKTSSFGYRYLAGWAYVTGQETRGQKVYIQLEKPDGVVVHYSTFPVERPDVGSFFKSSLYDASGFTAVIPVADGIDVDACSICLVVRNDSGTYKSARWKTGLRLSPGTKVPGGIAN